MVLVALLFLPCMVIVTTVALPLLLLVIAVIAIPILLYYDCSNIMQQFPITNCSSSYLSEDSSAAVPLHYHHHNRTSIPPAIGVSPRTLNRRSDISTHTASKRSTSSIYKKKVTFQVCDEHSPPNNENDLHHQQPLNAALHMQSSIVWPTESLLHHRRRQNPYHFHTSRDAIPTMNIPYQNTLQQHRSEQIYHHPVCVR